MSSTNLKWAGVLLAVALAWPATAATAIARPEGVSGAEVVKVLQDAGYRAQLDKDDDGDPRIVTKMSGATVHVVFYDCAQDRCGSLQLAVALDLEQGFTLEGVNRFNAQYRYARAHLDDEMDPFLQFDFEVLHSSPSEHIASQIALWEDVLGKFLQATQDRDGADAGDDGAA